MMPLMKFKPAKESEKLLLGALLLDSRLMTDINNKLCARDFHGFQHYTIFESMQRIHRARGMFDPAIIADDMQVDGGYLYELANECPSTANIQAHADIIREKSVQRMLMECTAQEKCNTAELSDISQVITETRNMLARYFELCAAEIRSRPLTKYFLLDTLGGIFDAVLQSCDDIDKN